MLRSASRMRSGGYGARQLRWQIQGTDDPLASSDRIEERATIKLASLIGIKNVVIMARRFGWKALDPYLPWRWVPRGNAAGDGFRVRRLSQPGLQFKPYFIRRIEDYDRVKKERLRRRPAGSSSRTWRKDAQCSSLTSFARHRNGCQVPRPAARGKTGTPTISRMPGLSDSALHHHGLSGWLDTKRSLGERQSGAVVALPIWIDFMQRLLKDTPEESFATVETTDPMVTENPEGGAPPARSSLLKVFGQSAPSVP